MVLSTHASMTVSISLTVAVAMTMTVMSVSLMICTAQKVMTALMKIHLLSRLVSLFVVLSIKFVTCR